MLVSLSIPAGVFRNGTNYQSQGRFYDADLWRFHEGTLRPIGGWAPQSRDAMTGKARQIVTWQDNANQAWTAVGTHSHLYALSRSGALTDITPSGFTVGRESGAVGSGFGTGPYGAEAYGTSRLNTSNILPASVWSLDNYGEVLVGTQGGIIYEWAPDTTTDAVAVTGAPTAESLIVTEERIIMALGADSDPRAVAWCDAEDRNDWTPSSINLAGSKQLTTSGKLRCGKRVLGGYLLFTDVDVHEATYEGLPLVYRFQRLSTGCGVASKGAVAVVDNKAFWMGENGFWSYDGHVSPLSCDVSDYVFSDINRTQISKVSCWHNSSWGEVWWHYPSADSTEVNRYVVFNYREGHWTIGTMDRLCGTDRGVLQNPLLVSSAGLVFQHETGDLKDRRQPFLTSGPVEIGKGDRVMEVHSIIPDEGNLGDVSVSFYAADYPMSPQSRVGAATARAKTDVRFSGRRVAVQMTAKSEQDFRVGDFRFDVKPGAMR